MVVDIMLVICLLRSVLKVKRVATSTASYTGKDADAKAKRQGHAIKANRGR